MTVYLDLVMILNFFVDFFLLMGTNRISGHPPGGGRAAAAAVLGALYAGACVLPGFRFLGNILWRMVSLALMCGIAFGWRKVALRRSILFVFLSMALGGIALGLGTGGFWAIIMGALGVCILCVLGFGGKLGQRYVQVKIRHRGQQVDLTALVDTGNTLRDPVTGMPVLVADAQAGHTLLRLTPGQLSRPAETVASACIPGLRLIPYHAVGSPTGMLLGLRMEHLEVNGKQEQMIVAFAPQKIGQTYQALTGGVV